MDSDNQGIFLKENEEDSFLKEAGGESEGVLPAQQFFCAFFVSGFFSSFGGSNLINSCGLAWSGYF